MSLSGVLSLYPLLTADKSLPHSVPKRPFFTSGDLGADRAVVFIGGLFNGLMDPPYLVNLSSALEKANWKLIQIYWTGSYTGFGTGSLDRDRDEMSSLIDHLRSKEGIETVVIMGHSTGSQDVIHYLSSTDNNGSRARVEGGIMQAPASDRQYFTNDKVEGYQLWKDALKIAEGLIAEGKKDQLLDDALSKQLGCPFTAYRVHSLVGTGGDDDYFSSDLPDTNDPPTPHVHPLSSSFGKISVPALALWSEKDEYRYLDDQKPLLERWVKASDGKLVWKIIKDATHAVEQPGPQEELTRAVVSWLSEHFD